MKYDGVTTLAVLSVIFTFGLVSVTSQSNQSSQGLNCDVGKCMLLKYCKWYDSIVGKTTGTCASGGRDWICCIKKRNGPSYKETERTTVPQHFSSTSTTSNHLSEEISRKRGWNKYGKDRNPNRSFKDTDRPFHYESCGIRGGGGANWRQKRSSEDDVSSNNDVQFLESKDWSDNIQSAKVVGGRETEPFSWPWMAALFKENHPGGISSFICAATLVAPRYILTAAHVFNRKEIREASYFVRLGTYTGSESFGDYKIKRIHLHPQYRQRFHYNDIALLELESPVYYSKYIYPVCLPANKMLCNDSELVGKNVTVIGWGDDAFGGKSSEVLQEAMFPVVSRRTCNASYIKVASSSFPQGVVDSMLCAGDINGGKDACQGDSGGPLTLLVGHHWVQVGVVSFGYRCGDSQYPGVYTKVAYFMDWIHYIIG